MFSPNFWLAAFGEAKKSQKGQAGRFKGAKSLGQFGLSPGKQSIFSSFPS
jgi:hypothetical protein